MDLRDGGDQYSSFEPTELIAGKSGQPFTARMRLESEGQGNVDAVLVRFYASVDTAITTSDYSLGQTSVSLSAGGAPTVTLRGTVPTSIPEGSYYVGWIIDPANVVPEEIENNNTAYKTSVKLRVINPTKLIIYVDAEARGANDGSSWHNARTSLQDGLALARIGHEVRVADGIYTPDRGIGLARGDRTASFVIVGGVTVVGGYAGAGTLHPDARDPKLYPTILSGDLNGDDRPVADPCNLAKEPSRADNSWHVLTVVKADRPVILDGVQVSGGHADAPTDVSILSGDSQGAGLYLWSGSVLLRGCLFSDHWAGSDGGAIYAADSRVELLDCTFRANAAGIDPWAGQPRGTGGALQIDGKSQLAASRCRFLGNFAGLQGGAIDSDKGDALLTGCLFLQNAAGPKGGGALFNSEGKVALVNCLLNGNRADAGGGAIANGYGGTLTAVNCCLHGNYAQLQAGAIDNFYGSQATLTNCTLADNRQRGTSGAIVCGPALSPTVGGLSVSNCILWNGGSEIVSQGKTLVTVTRSDVQGGWTGTGNLNANPLFARPAGADGVLGTEDDDLRLAAGSPCTDRGDTTLLPADFGDLDGDGNTTEPLPVDLDSKTRVSGSAPDLGAYEVQSPSSGDC